MDRPARSPLSLALPLQARAPLPDRLPIVDLGAGAFHRTTVELGPSSLGGPKRAERQSVRMLEPLRTGRLDDASWGTGMGALRILLGDRSTSENAASVGVASSWFGEVEGGADFLAEARARFGLSITRLERDEEARLIWTSARTQAPWARGAIAAIGLGASNLRLAVGVGQACLFATSLPLGALRLLATHVPRGQRLTGQHASALTNAVLETAGPACAVIRGFQPGAILLAGGTARALARAARRLPGGATGTFGRRDAMALVALLSGRGAEAVAGWSGARDRSDTLGPSAIALTAVLALLGHDEGIVVRGGLRDGVIQREIEECRWGRAPAATEAD